MPSITALLPAYNEEVSIGSVVLRARQYADRVIVVDDGSADHTAEVAALAGAEVLRHARNQGKGAALKPPLSPPPPCCTSPASALQLPAMCAGASSPRGRRTPARVPALRRGALG